MEQFTNQLFSAFLGPQDYAIEQLSQKSATPSGYSLLPKRDMLESVTLSVKSHEDFKSVKVYATFVSHNPELGNLDFMKYTGEELYTLACFDGEPLFYQVKLLGNLATPENPYPVDSINWSFDVKVEHSLDYEPTLHIKHTKVPAHTPLLQTIDSRLIENRTFIEETRKEEYIVCLNHPTKSVAFWFDDYKDILEEFTLVINDTEITLKREDLLEKSCLLVPNNRIIYVLEFPEGKTLNFSGIKSCKFKVKTTNNGHYYQKFKYMSTYLNLFRQYKGDVGFAFAH